MGFLNYPDFTLAVFGILILLIISMALVRGMFKGFEVFFSLSVYVILMGTLKIMLEWSLATIPVIVTSAAVGLGSVVLYITGKMANAFRNVDENIEKALREQTKLSAELDRQENHESVEALHKTPHMSPVIGAVYNLWSIVLYITGNVLYITEKVADAFRNADKNIETTLREQTKLSADLSRQKNHKSVKAFHKYKNSYR